MKKTNKLPTRFAAYLRCSSDDQRFGDYTTIDTQRAINAARISELGGQLVAEYSDEGRTGSNLKRSGWRSLVADASARKFDAVVVTYMSRLARGEAYHVAEYLLREAGASVELVKEKFDPGMVGQLHKGLQIVMDGNYCRQVSEWTRTKQGQMVAMGYHTGGVRPFGYCTEPVPGMQAVVMSSGKTKPAPRRLIPHPDEAPLVRCAYELFLSSRSIAHVQRYLRSVDATRRWPITLVRAMLESDRYRGVARFGDNVNPAAHEAIVSEQLWDAAQALLASPRAQIDARAAGHHAGRLLDPNTYYLRGIVHCASCGGRMTPASATGKTGRVGYYECIQAAKGQSACPVRRVNAGSLHAAVLAEIQRCASHPSRLERLYEAAIRHIPQPTEARDELQRLRRNLRETQKKISRVVEAIKQVGALAALADEARNLQQLASEQEIKINTLQLSQIRRTIDRPTAATVAGLWVQLFELWPDLSEAERGQLLQLVVLRIDIVKKTEGTIWLSLSSHADDSLVHQFTHSVDGKFLNCAVLSADNDQLVNYAAPDLLPSITSILLISPPVRGGNRKNESTESARNPAHPIILPDTLLAASAAVPQPP